MAILEIRVGDRVICHYGSIEGAIGTITKIFQDPPSIDVAISPYDPKIRQQFVTSPDGFIHFRLEPGEFEPVSKRITSLPKTNAVHSNREVN